MLDYYPPFLRTDYRRMALCNCAADEFNLLDLAVSKLERNCIPNTAEEHLNFYEAMLGVSVDNPNMTLVERKNTVLAFLKRVAMSGSTADWVEVAGLILATTWSYSVGDPDHNVLTVRVPYTVGSIQAELAEALLGEITPAVMLINVTYSQGFILDESLLDEDLL